MKKIALRFLYCLCLSCAFNVYVQAQDFITVWDLSITGSGGTQITFDVGTTGTCNYTWEAIPAGATGSGSFSGSTLTITGLPANAMIRLKIDTSNFNRININSGIDRNRLKDVQQWGGVHWNSMQNAFGGCSNLNCTATDIPDLLLVTDMSFMFANCVLLNGPANIGNWNTGTVTNMSYLFSSTSIFNQPLGNWNTGNVTNMTYMFNSALIFNQPIGNWNTANVTDMTGMFRNANFFNQPIGNWTTANVINMSWMFYSADNFNQTLNNWNTANVTDMRYMFQNAISFNQTIGSWNTVSVTNMRQMFQNATTFNQAIGSWNTGNVTNMSQMFNYAAAFNQPIGVWNTANVTDMSSMFNAATNFNQTISNWNTGNVLNMNAMFEDAVSFNKTIANWNTVNTTNMSRMFKDASAFNLPIGNWNTTNVTNMSSMFNGASAFNQAIGNWNTANVTNMRLMFASASNFNQAIGNWNTANVTNMGYMFSSINYNQPIGNWNTGNVTDMSYMFWFADYFNQPIGNWNTANVIDMRWMFADATSFNQPIGNWNTGNVTDMSSMFNSAANFNHSLGLWQLNSNVSMQSMFNSSGLDCTNYGTTLIGWSNNLNVPSNRNLGAQNIKYSTAVQNARNFLINNKGWTILGDALDLNCCLQQYVTLNDTACVSYFFNGQTLTNNGTYYDTLNDMYGCDSIITLNLTIIPGTASTTNASICFSQTPYNWNGQNLNSPGTYTDTFVNANGCDSIATLVLNISLCGQCQPNFTVNWTPFVDTLVESQTWINTSGTVLIPIGAKVKFDANVGGYVQMNPGFKAEYGSIFVAQAYNGCTPGAPQLPPIGKVFKGQMSAAADEIVLYPNPTSGMIHIKHEEKLTGIQIFDMVGKLVINQKCDGETETNIDLSNLPNGVYHVKAVGYNSIKVIKNN